MQKQQLISIKDAATSTGISEETIRQHIRSGKITGEKKNYIFWDEWFVSSKDLAKIRDSLSNQELDALTPAVVSSVSETMNQAVMAGVGASFSAATDNGIKSTVNYSWMPDNTTGHRFDGSKHRTSSDGLPPSLAAEIERAFAPSTAFDAFGARAYLNHSNEREQERNEEDDVDADDSHKAGDLDNRTEVVSRFEVGRPTGRRRRSAQNPNLQNANSQAYNSQAPSSDYRVIAKTVAEEFLAPLLCRLEAQSTLIYEKDLLIAEQAAQLKLLPDFQRHSEESRRLAEEKQQEALRLRQNLTWERKKALIKISAWQMKHVKVENQLKDIEKQMTEMQDQKDSEVNYLHCQLTQLQDHLTKAQLPWWKKIFSSK